MILITGGNAGIGKATAAALAMQGSTLVLASRNAAKGEVVSRAIRSISGNDRVQFMPLDLASFESITRFAENFKSRFQRLDVLLNNAGLVASGKRTETKDGLETTIGVNHFGTFLLTGLLLDRLKAAGSSRIVTVSSRVHARGKLILDDLQLKEQFSAMKAYAQSKLANILFTYELARRLNGEGVTVNCLHPGMVRSSFYDRPSGLKAKLAFGMIKPFLIPVEKGAETSIFLAASPEVEGITGKYFVKCMETPSSPLSYDQELAQSLWEISEQMTGFTYPVR